MYDAFICHASEDKASFVRPLAKLLQENHVEVWYDEFTLKIGDSLREAVDKGLRASRFGIVVLSPAFFNKRFPQRELAGLFAREAGQNTRLVLPVWHNITREEVLEQSPMLADLFASNSAKGV